MSPARPRPAGSSRGPTAPLSAGERAGLTLAATAVVATLTLWGTGQLIALVNTGSWLPAGLDEAPQIVSRLGSNPTDPAHAFEAAGVGLLRNAVLFWTVSGGMVAMLAGLGAAALRRFGHSVPEEAASARWATRSDLKPLIVRRPTPGRITLGTAHGRLLAAEPGHSLLVMGPTQSGKTSGLAIPAIRDWHGPVVATSVKGDLLNDTLAARTAVGDVWVYDPTASVPNVPTATWSPLAGCHDWQGALRTASWLTESARDGQLHDGDFWFANAAKLLAPLLFAAATSGRTMADVVQWVDLQETKEVSLELEIAGVPEAIAAFAATRNREERARSSVYTTTETILRAFADPAVAASAATSEIDPNRLLDGGHHTLYVSAPIHEQTRLRPLFTALVQTVLTASYQHAATNGRLDPPLLVVLDEAANIAPLRELAQIASTAAGLGVQLVTVWQDRAQIVSRYGAQASTVFNNHRAKLTLGGSSDSETTRTLTDLIGEAEQTRRSRSTDASGRFSTTEAVVAAPLTSPGTLRVLEPFEGVLLYGHLPPAHLHLVRDVHGRRPVRSLGSRASAR